MNVTHTAIWNDRAIAAARAQNPAYVSAEAEVFRSRGLNATSHVLVLKEPRTRVRVVEVNQGEPVLFLHGFSHCVADWAPLTRSLSTVRSVMVDQPGHGASAPIDFRGVDLRDWFNAMLCGCLDALGLESAHVVGHSQGGMFALWLALAAPRRVRSVVTIGVPAAAFGARLDSLRFLARPGLGPFLFRVPKPAAFYRRILSGTMGSSAVEAHPDLVSATYLATHRSGYATTVSSELRELFRGLDANPRQYALRDEELRGITQPVLVLWGNGDTGFQAIAEAQARAALMPHSRFEVIPGGHTPWLDDSAACATRMAAFFDH